MSRSLTEWAILVNRIVRRRFSELDKRFAANWSFHSRPVTRSQLSDGCGSEAKSMKSKKLQQQPEISQIKIQIYHWSELRYRIEHKQSVHFEP